MFFSPNANDTSHL